MIPYGDHPKLYLYWDLVNKLAWAKDPADFRRLTGATSSAIRFSHKLIALPPGYVRKNGSLANDPIERVNTPTEVGAK